MLRYTMFLVSSDLFCTYSSSVLCGLNYVPTVYQLDFIIGEDISLTLYLMSVISNRPICLILLCKFEFEVVIYVVFLIHTSTHLRYYFVFQISITLEFQEIEVQFHLIISKIRSAIRHRHQNHVACPVCSPRLVVQYRI